MKSDNRASERRQRHAPSARLVQALRQPDCYPHDVKGIEVVETHISWVVLTGEYAYKIKKPVKLPFLDFSTLELRRHFCEEELRLHRALAPGLYLEVVPIRGTADRPVVGGAGKTIDYAVKMRQFPQEALASNLVARGALTAGQLTRLAADLARFHSAASVAGAETAYGGDRCVVDQATTVIKELLSIARAADDRLRLQALRVWIEREHGRLQGVFASRKRDGFVRECHGDLHLENVVLLENRLVPFDGIEFSPVLRWIDVMSEVAFLLMDLAGHGQSNLGSVFLNAYVENTGDYAGLSVLRFYIVYRALVRALVHALRARQLDVPQQDPFEPGAARSYVRLAARYAHAGSGAIMIMHGLSGSGKSTIAAELLASLGAVRIRSDVERKRLHGLNALARSGSTVDAGLYTEESTRATYRRLRELAENVAEAGYPVIVDAAFLKHRQRDDFRSLACELRVPLTIVHVRAAPDVLRERVAHRSRSGTDASEADAAVLEHQLASEEPLSQDELPETVPVDGSRPFDGETRRNVLEALAARANINPDGVGGGLAPIRQPPAHRPPMC